MHPTRLVLLLAVILLSCASSVAEQPGPQFWRKVGCEPFEPRTKLERLDDSYQKRHYQGLHAHHHGRGAGRAD